MGKAEEAKEEAKPKPKRKPRSMALADFLTTDLGVFSGRPFQRFCDSKTASLRMFCLTSRYRAVLAGRYGLKHLTIKSPLRLLTLAALLPVTVITVDSVAYTVRETRLIDDGLLCEVSLQKT